MSMITTAVAAVEFPELSTLHQHLKVFAATDEAREMLSSDDPADWVLSETVSGLLATLDNRFAVRSTYLSPLGKPAAPESWSMEEVPFVDASQIRPGQSRGSADAAAADSAQLQHRTARWKLWSRN